jgi:organic hydroperoxide reductase OsmC/OhrA
MARTSVSIVKQRQDPLRERYRSAVNEARITDGARTLNDGAGDPFHGIVVAGEGNGSQWRFGIHRAVGGDHDLPNPGDMLCAALAGCLDSTIRMIADRLDIRIESRKSR